MPLVERRTFEAYRKQVLAARLMIVEGKLQREGIVIGIPSGGIDQALPFIVTQGFHGQAALPRDFSDI
jgi:hypothetical protein